MHQYGPLRPPISVRRWFVVRLLLTHMTSVETLPMTYENMVVPQTIVRHATILSMSFVGTKSP